MGWTEQDIINHQLRLAEGLASSAHQREKKRNKYGVSPKEERTVGGIVFASKAEARAYSTLMALKSAGKVAYIVLQPRFKFPTGFSYVADFEVGYSDGRVEVIDVKGFEPPIFKLKRKCLAYFNPEVNLVLWK